MSIVATYTRSGTTVACTSADHGLVVGDIIYVDFTTGGALDGSYTVASVQSTSLFTFSTVASGTITTSNLKYLLTGGATYTAQNSILRINATNHGAEEGGYVNLSFLGGSYTRDGNYLVTEVTTVNDFAVPTEVLNNSTGYVKLAKGTPIVGDGLIKFVGTTEAEARFFHIAGAGSIVFDGEAFGEERSMAIGDSTEIRFDGVAEWESRQSFIYVDSTMWFAGSSNGSVGVPFAAVAEIRLDGTAAAAPTGGTFDFECNGKLNFTSQFTPSVIRGRVSVQDLLDDAASVWGLPSARAGNTDQRGRLVNYANAAIQEMFGRAEQLNYFNRAERTYTLSSGDRVIVMEDDVQNIKGYVRLSTNDRPLNPVATQNEIERYTSTFLTADDDLTVPHAYWVRRQQATTAYGFQTALVFAPAPSASTALKVEVMTTAPRWNWEDYESRTPLSISHDYAQSVLYPLMKWACAASRDAKVSESVMPQIKDAYERARKMLGYVDSAPSSVKDQQLVEVASR